MKNTIFWVLTIITAVMSLTGLAYAHPGRTDSSGGHTCRTNCPRWGLSYGQYHYHNAGYATPTPIPIVVKPKPFQYRWLGQTPTTLSVDGKAHIVNAKAGDIVAMSVTLTNYSGDTIRGKTSLGAIPVGNQVPIGTVGVGVSNDAYLPWLDASSFVLNHNRFAYYDSSDVAPYSSFTITWNLKISDNAAPGTYNLYANIVKEYSSWAQQIGWDGRALSSPDIFWRFVITA